MTTIREAIIETAYAQIAARESLTVEMVGSNRARVPLHWRPQAEHEAKPYLDAIEEVLADEATGLGAEVEAIAYGFGKYEGDGAINFWDDEIDREKFAKHLTRYLVTGRADGDDD